MRYQTTTPMQVLALVASAIFINMGCAGDGIQPTTDHAGDTASVYMELGACESDLACDEVDYDALGIAHLQSCLTCTCTPSPDDAETNTLQLSFLAECVSDLGCVTDLDCAAFADACNTASCEATACIVTPIADAAPEAAGQCEARACDPVTGWGNTPLAAETPCDANDACATGAFCDGAGVCVIDPVSNICCYRYDDCMPTSCEAGELHACRAPTAEEAEVTGDFGRCFCVEEDSSPLSQSCCTTHGGMNCEPPIEEAPNGDPICAIDPWCCNIEWDMICVNLYDTLYPDVCNIPEEPPTEEEPPSEEEPETTEVSLELISPYYFQGCVGVPPEGSIYPSCTWSPTAGETIGWDPAEGQVALFTMTDGSSWPLSVDCDTGAITFTVSVGLVFVDPAKLEELGCIGTCRSGGQQVLCSGQPLDI